jgi:predicted acyl esterase
MSDGVKLGTDLYLPHGRRRFPAIVTRLPYDKCNRENMIEFIAGAATERAMPSWPRTPAVISARRAVFAIR